MRVRTSHGQFQVLPERWFPGEPCQGSPAQACAAPSSAGTEPAPPRAPDGRATLGTWAWTRTAARPHPALPRDHPSLASLPQRTCPGLPLPTRLSSPLRRAGPAVTRHLRPRSAWPRVPPTAASPLSSRRSAPRPLRSPAARHPGRHRAQSVA